ncbi:MAG: polysaccharide biosynthesis tyrosine autokinase [Desmonostoc vinosum HA7617-LM4]|jgi:capsular exopolysaccharide synthesis family protein|nr:polysaccharide biosynthesis tyrosine autokinase [Desmonostoc vinosum HA7617-LM4]
MANTGLNQGQLVTTSAHNTVDIKQLSTILHRRRFVILGVSCVAMSVASFLAVMAKPTYQSSMQILVSSNFYEEATPNNISKQANGEISKPNIPSVDYTAQQKIMLSSRLIQKAVDSLRKNYREITLEDIKGQKEKSEKSPLAITPIEEEQGIDQASNQVFEVTFTGNDPVKTQQILQALQQVYQDYNVEQKKERLNKGMTFVNARIPETRKEVIAAEKDLEEFRKKNNLIDPEAQSKILLESLANVQKQLQTNRAELQDVRARSNNLEQKIASASQTESVSSRLSQSSRYQTLLSEIQQTESALAKERLRYREDYPTVEKLKQQRQTQLALLQQEVERSLNDKTTKQGQTVVVDPQLVNELILTQTKSLGLVANEKSLAESEQRLRSELDKYPSLIAEYNRLLPKVETNRKTLDQLLQIQQSLGMKIAQGGFDWEVLEAPSLGTLTGDNRLLFLLGGTLAGPILGIAAALLGEMLSDAIYSARDLRRLTNVRVLGSVPKLAPRVAKKRLPSLPARRKQTSTSSIVDVSIKLPVHETLDMIYQNIQILRYPFPFKSLILTSALPREGKTTLTLGLGASAARMHGRILVIDANLRHPTLHQTLELSNDWGLSLLLLDETITHIQNYIQPIHPSIDVLTAGPMPEDTVKLLSSHRMKELIEIFEETYDLVLIDAPPILGTVDAIILASFCNGVVMVERMGQVTKHELTQATEILSKLNLIGIIANEVKYSPKMYTS